MEDDLYQRRMLAREGADWATFALPDGSVQLDLGYAGLLLPELLFRRFCDFVALGQRCAARGNITATTPPQRVLRYCHRTHMIVIGIEQTILRFHPHEFARLAGLCRRTIEVLGPAQGMGMPPLPHISRN
jgi:hypothetical protein